MKGKSFFITVDLSRMVQSLEILDAEMFPRLHEAVGVIAEQAVQDWRDAVWQAPGVWVGEKKPYFQSIQWRYTGPFAAEAWSDYRGAEELEEGRPARDLKRILDSSLKVRLAKDGSRYLYIPFRHNTPGHDALAAAMPPEIYAVVADDTFEKSRITGIAWRLSGTGALAIRTRPGHHQVKGEVVRVARRTYLWGSRLPAGLVPKKAERHKTDPYAGMVRMQTSSGKQQSSAYLTFRTMSEKSSGWIIPPRPGLNLARNVAQRLEPLAERIFREAVRRDLGAS